MEEIMACLELRTSENFTIIDIFNPELSFECVLTINAEFLPFQLEFHKTPLEIPPDETENDRIRPGDLRGSSR